LRLPDRLQSREGSRRFGKETMQRDVKPEARSLGAFFFYLHLYTPERSKESVLRTIRPVQLKCHSNGASAYGC
jgi:hypothetical protein